MIVTLAWISLIAAFASALIIAVDELRHPQKMWIMNLVWPITALYFSVFAVWAYFRLGKRPQHEAMSNMGHASMQHTGKHAEPTWPWAPLLVAQSYAHLAAGKHWRRLRVGFGMVTIFRCAFGVFSVTGGGTCVATADHLHHLLEGDGPDRSRPPLPTPNSAFKLAYRVPIVQPCKSRLGAAEDSLA